MKMYHFVCFWSKCTFKTSNLTNVGVWNSFLILFCSLGDILILKGHGRRGHFVIPVSLAHVILNVNFFYRHFTNGTWSIWICNRRSIILYLLCPTWFVIFWKFSQDELSTCRWQNVMQCSDCTRAQRQHNVEWLLPKHLHNMVRKYFGSGFRHSEDTRPKAEQLAVIWSVDSQENH